MAGSVAWNSTQHRGGIATAQPYQSSFPVTVRHLSVSLAQLAGSVSCGTKQPWFYVSRTVPMPVYNSILRDKRIYQLIHRLRATRRERSIITALSCQYDIRRGGSLIVFPIQKGRFPLFFFCNTAAVWDIVLFAY